MMSKLSFLWLAYLEIHGFSERTGKQYLLTKGDNNHVDDRGLYNPGQVWISREEIMGRVMG